MDQGTDNSLDSASPEPKLHWLTAELRTPVEVIRGLAEIIRLNAESNNLEREGTLQVVTAISEAANTIKNYLDEMVRSKGFYTPSKNISSTDILIALRQRLLEARAQNDMDTLQSLALSFGILEEVAEKKNSHPRISTILDDLGTSAFEAIHGIPWKSTIPSEEEIISALNAN